MIPNLIGQLLAALRSHGDKTCAIDHADTVRPLSYSELEQQSLALAAELQQRFVPEATDSPVVLGIVTRNTSQWLVADLACLFAGITSLPLPLAFSQAQAENLAAHCDGFLVDTAGQKTLNERWNLDLPASKVRHLDLPATPQPLRDEITGRNWICKIIHTSGTTSSPKGVRLSCNAIAQVLTSLRERMPANAHQRYLSLVPLSLLLEQVTAAYLPLLAGGTVHFLPENEPLLGEPVASPARLTDWILSVKPTAITVPPVMLNEFLQRLEQEQTEELTTYLTTGVHITCGGAAVGLDVLHALEAKGVHVFQGYGLSENASVVSVNTSSLQRLGSVGKPLSHVQVRIGADKTIEVKSTSLFSGYSGLDPSACAMSDDGWMDTGDLGELDSDGYLYVHGRKKNVICLANGRNVSPEQVELEYRKYAGVRDAAVFLDQEHGLVALLCVESEPDRKDLAQWSTKRFSDVERPSKLWLLNLGNPLLEELYTVTGRPKRSDIAEAFANRFSSSMERISTDEHACLSL
ncbi:AMP-binding protein [Pseudomonas capsici]|uniref:AMP-binding protein n=1 Tax=Pseudomonas capsici TaxID=2810614 RepID=UPI0021F0A762|nr:AMP-binding protein [Pseudomonas capsici]MCV4284081.1 AMP-binding protein [Pseudomonas capsici]